MPTGLLGNFGSLGPQDGPPESAAGHLRLIEMVLNGIQRLSEIDQAEARLHWVKRNLPRTATMISLDVSWSGIEE
jgi:hypothetical protein